jgi:hypothetical protein
VVLKVSERSSLPKLLFSGELSFAEEVGGGRSPLIAVELQTGVGFLNG